MYLSNKKLQDLVNNHKMDFKTRLKEEMDFADIQHKELAAKAEIKPRTLLTYVASEPSMPPADVAVRLAKALGVTVEYLVTGEHSESSLTAREKYLVQIFRKLSTIERKAVQVLMETLLENKT